MRKTYPFDQDVADEICIQLSCGKSLAEICRESPEISYDAVFRWLRENPEFAQDYTRAREDQAEVDADAISDIAGRVAKGELDPQAARVAIDAYKWTAGKRLPKKYGDKLDLGGGGGVKRVTVEFTGADDE